MNAPQLSPRPLHPATAEDKLTLTFAAFGALEQKQWLFDIKHQMFPELCRLSEERNLNTCLLTQLGVPSSSFASTCPSVRTSVSGLFSLVLKIASPFCHIECYPCMLGIAGANRAPCSVGGVICS